VDSEAVAESVGAVVGAADVPEQATAKAAASTTNGRSLVARRDPIEGITTTE
jgi:hypothetical protein